MALAAGRWATNGFAGLCDRQLLGPLQQQRPQTPQKCTGPSTLRRQLQATSGGSNQVRTTASAHGRSSSRQQPDEAQLRFDDRDGSAVPSGEQTSAVNGASAITLHYSSGWQQPTMLYSLQGADWVRCPLDPVASSAQWKSATFRLNGTTAAPGQPDPPLLEFVITEGESWDKPIDGTNYIINKRGRFTLRDGTVAAVDGEPVLVVSDLDDTMIGDDEATAVFKRFWDTMAVPRGSRLIYNTGRALHKCISLFEEKRSVLPPPDYLITSVGTKVYNCVDGEWVVDADHVAMLDYAWDLDIVREATYAALAAVGKDNMHFRPPDEQNEHKVTCGVSVAALDRGVLQQLDKTLRRDGVKARLITSGTGDWRFLDIVPLTAGKHEAMDYLRRKLGFSYESTVAAGDSGNDRAMFEGRNRGIIVGNSQPDLLDWLAAQRQQGVDDGRLVLTGKARARGILEGLAHFGFL